MTTNNEDSQNLAERALHDAIQIICKFMDVKTLNTMAEVCKHWRRAVFYEKNRRYCIKHLRLPYKTGKSGLGNKLDWDLYVPLLIYDSNLEKSLSLPVESKEKAYYNTYKSNGLEEELLEDFQKELPNKAVVLKVSEFFTADENQSFKEQCDEKTSVGNCDILGLFLPHVERIRVDVASIRLKHCKPVYRGYRRLAHKMYTSKRDIALMNRLSDKLRLNDSDYRQSTILILGHLLQPPLFYNPYTQSVVRINNCVLELCRRARKNGKEITLGTLMGTKMVQEEGNQRNSLLGWFDHLRPSNWFYKVNKDLLVSVVLRISGACLESWSTFIHYRSNRDDIESSLLKLERRIWPGRHCTGLFFAPKCPHPGCSHVNHPCGDSQGMMSTLKRIFPDIQFLATFENWEEYDPEDLPMSDYEDTYDKNDPRQGLALNRKVSVIIISHN